MDIKKVLIEDINKIGITTDIMPQRKKGEALLKIRYSGICGSDVATYTGNQPFSSYPRVPGHEFSAEIIEIDDNDKFKVGDVVTATPYFNCKTCYPCSKGKKNCCEDNKTMGVHVDGSFSQYITMPIEHLVSGEGLSPMELALVEPFGISYHGVKRADIKKGDNVLVIGCGAIGLFAMLSAKERGAKVFICDVFDKRLSIAKELGADEIINVSDQDLYKEIDKLTGGNGVDVSIECVGHSATFLGSIETTCFGGKILLIGNGKQESTFNHSILLKKELTVYGSRNSADEFGEVIGIIKNSDIDITKIVTDVYSYDNSIEAFEKLVNNDGSTLKILVEF